MRIQESELRIGNFVFNKHGEIHCIDINSFQRFRHPTMDGNPSGFTPIPLTEEILLKAGWKYYNGKTSGDLTKDTVCKVDLDFINGVIKIKSHYEEYGMYRDLPICYLHQLQNIYFALTGQELEINL